MNGYTHWILQRITAVVLIPCSFAFVVLVLVYLAGPDGAKTTLSAFMPGGLAESMTGFFTNSSSLNTFLVLGGSFLVLHIRLGGEVILEDYVHGDASLAFSLVTLRLLALQVIQFLFFAFVL